jgi:dynein heavy chain
MLLDWSLTAVSLLQKYLENEKRCNYTTPKTFLEQINLYRKLLSEKTEDLQHRIARLENGLEKLKTTAVQVEELKVVLAEQEVELSMRNIAADKLIQVRIAFLCLLLTM